MPLRIGFDLDGTVADMYSALHTEALALFGDKVLARSANKKAPPAAEGAEKPPEKTASNPTTLAMNELHLTSSEQDRLWNHVSKIENFWTTLPEMEPGIIARIAKTAAERQWEIIFLTTRPPTAGELTQLQSQRWLDAHGFRYPSVMVVQRSRGRIADALQLDAFVDDRLENCLDLAVESQAKVILMWHGHLNDVPAGAKRLGVQAVTKISDAVDLLERLDDLRNKPGFMRKIRRALGGGDDGEV